MRTCFSAEKKLFAWRQVDLWSKWSCPLPNCQTITIPFTSFSYYFLCIYISMRWLGFHSSNYTPQHSSFRCFSTIAKYVCSPQLPGTERLAHLVLFYGSMLAPWERRKSYITKWQRIDHWIKSTSLMLQSSDLFKIGTKKKENGKSHS